MKDCGKPVHGPKQQRVDLQDYWGSPVVLPVGKRQESCNRECQARWDAREMRTATTKVRRETYEEFQRVCQDQETTPYAVLRDFLLAFVDYFGGGGSFSDEEETTEEETTAEVRDKSPWTGWHTSG